MTARGAVLTGGNVVVVPIVIELSAKSLPNVRLS
jgi:hypothetical protein